MRALATIAMSFSAAVFAAVLLPWEGWIGPAAGGFALLGAVGLLAKGLLRKHKRAWLRWVLISLSAAAALVWFGFHQTHIVEPVRDKCGAEHHFSALVAEFPEKTRFGAKVTVSLGHRARAVYYGTERVMELRPGQRVRGMAQWQDSSEVRGEKLAAFTARGLYALLYDRGAMTVTDESVESPRWWPQRACRAVQEKIDAIWQEDTTAAFVCAILTGERRDMDPADSAVMAETGLSHLFAVSGLHCAFLVTLLGLLLPKYRRRLVAAVTVGVLLFYMAMVGMTASVVRSCIMMLFFEIAPLFRRDSDGPTSWSAALLVILLVNPWAAAGIGLQLSFAATGGILVCAGPVYRWLTAAPIPKGFFRRVWSFFSANLAATLGALVFTVPLTAYYFDIVTLTAPISSLLILPVASWMFMLAFVLAAVGFVWLPLAQIAGWAVWGMVHYTLGVAYAFVRVPFHAVYLTNPYLKYWLAGCYGAGLLCLPKRWRRVKIGFVSVLAVLALVWVVHLGAADYPGGPMALVQDVGQGQCVLVSGGDGAVLVDCGSSDGYRVPGREVVHQMHTMGIHHLRGVAVTHFHNDHINGLGEVMACMGVDTLYLPRTEEGGEAADTLRALAERYGCEVRYVGRERDVFLGEVRLHFYPPVGKGGPNEQGLTVLASAGEKDLLITGDMNGATERKLVERFDLPDIEALVVSHHGSKHSSTSEFLHAVRPERAIISVGDNSYGHPTQEAVDRLEEAGARVQRTDVQGDIFLTVHEGE